MSKLTKYGKSGRYVRKTFTYNGIRHYIYGSSEEELFEKKKKAIKLLEDNEEKRVNPTLDEYYEELTDRRRREQKGSTLRAQRSQYNTLSEVKLMNNVNLGKMRIKEVKKSDIEYVRTYLLKNGKSPENLNIIIAHLNHIFECAVKDDIITKNPIKALKKLRRESETVNETKHRALSIDETQKFLKVAEDRKSIYINCFKMMLLTGTRLGELGALNDIDFDSTKGKLHIRKTISRDEAGSYYISKDLKTKSGRRDIPLVDEMITVMKSQKELNLLIFGTESTDSLFRSSDNQLLREYTLNREIKRICKDAGVRYFTSHAFRNTFATRFLEQKPWEIKMLSEILGHSDVSITYKYYAHVMDENKNKAMNEVKIF